MTLSSGLRLESRLVRSDDEALLGAYFEGLSPDTRGRYGPHPLTADFARELCANLDFRSRLPFVAGRDDAEAIIAYFILDLGVGEKEQQRYTKRGTPLVDADVCTFAPSVADDYQSSGVGSAIMPGILDVARRPGRTHIVLMGGTTETNFRAIHFYEKFGFQKVGHFQTRVGNWDMILEL